MAHDVEEKQRQVLSSRKPKRNDAGEQGRRTGKREGIKQGAVALWGVMLKVVGCEAGKVFIRDGISVEINEKN